MAFGLNVYNEGTNNFSPYIVDGLYNTSTAASNSTLWNADNSGSVSRRWEVIEAFATCRYAPPTGSESSIRYWMGNGLGANKYLFTNSFTSSYNNSSAAAQNAQNQLRDRAASVLSPYPLRQNTNEVVLGSLSTQDTFGNCLTSLFLGVSDFNIPDHDLSFSYGTQHSNWVYDLATINNLANNWLTENHGTTPTNTSITAPNILGATYFNAFSTVTVIGSGGWYFPSATDFTIEFYFTTEILSSSRKLLLQTSTEDIIVSATSSSGNFIEITLGTTVYSIPNTLMGGIYKYNIDTLYHLAITQNGTNLRVFIDGEKVLDVYAVLPTLGGSASLYIGGKTFYSTGTSGHRGYIAALRIVKGKAIYTDTFPKITRTAKSDRAFILTQYAKYSVAALNPREIDIQYWMLNGIQPNTPTVQFSTTSITWNQVYTGSLAANTAFSQTFKSCIGREVVVSQFILGEMSLTQSLTLGSWVHTSGTGTISINASSTDTYIIILMR